MAVKTTIRNNRGGTKEVRLTSLSAIRAFCLECVGWSYYEVEKCTAPLCRLFPFRFGKNPSRKGIGGNPEFMKKDIT
jgi:hypothetical protein